MKLRTFVAAALVTTSPLFAYSVTAGAQPSVAAKEDAMQLKADKAALQREIKRLQSDEATLKSDSASGRMAAESKDASAVYTAREAIKNEKRDIAVDKAGSLQMKADKAGLHRYTKQLQAAEAQLKADTEEGRMAAESRDAEKVYIDRQIINGERKDVANDNAMLVAGRSSKETSSGGGTTGSGR